MKVGLGTLALALAFPAAASADNTPAGPATLTVRNGPSVGCPGSYPLPFVLVAWEVSVGEGGQAGTIQPRFGTRLGDPVELPAEAGTYRFPAPHFRFGDCGSNIALLQTTGNHAVLRGTSYQDVIVSRDGQPDEVIPGTSLDVRPVTEPDLDEDQLGERTEDRTELRVSATGGRVDDGHGQVTVTVTNAGPLAADLPTVNTSLASRTSEGCRYDSSKLLYPWSFGDCGLSRIAPGESRTVTLTGEVKGAQTVFVSVRSEGPDLAFGDNETSVGIPAPVAFTLATAPSQRLKQGVSVKVRAATAGRARVTVGFTVRGRTVKLGKLVTLKAATERTVTVRATGAKLRSLRRAARRGALTAQITVRTISGKTPVTATTKVLM